MIPWAKPKIFLSEKINLNKALNSSWISGGNYIDKFENKISRRLKIKYVSSVSNGTAALHSAFLSLNLKRGDEIVIPGFGYLAAANISYLMELKIKFADVNIQNFCLDYEHLKKLITSKTKAVVFIHTYGNSGDIQKISSLLKKKKIYLIEDAAEAFGTKVNNKHAGTFGDIGTFSFHATKNITTGEGGCIVTNNKKIYENVNLYKNHGVKNKRYYHIVPGHNFRLTNLQAALGYSQMNHLNEIIKKRKLLYYEYLKAFSKFENFNLSFQKINKSNNFVPWTLAIYLKDSSEQKRDKIINEMKKKGIETRNGFYCPQRLKMYKNIKKLNNSLHLSNRVICLPLFYELTKKEINKIVNIFNKILNN